MLDFEKIFIPSRDLQILKNIYLGAVLTLHEVDASYLLSLGFIDRYALSQSGNQYVVTQDGIRYMEYLREKEKREEDQRKAEEEKEKFNRTSTWVSIIISNLIALAALIISIVK